MTRLARDGMAEPVSRDQILRHVRGQRNIYFLCSADHEQDWQPYPVDPYSAVICDDHTATVVGRFHQYLCPKYIFSAQVCGVSIAGSGSTMSLMTPIF